jgi:hypothetical protein
MRMTLPSERYDPWYAKAAFGVLLFGLVGSLIALYSGASDPILARLLDILSSIPECIGISCRKRVLGRVGSARPGCESKPPPLEYQATATYRGIRLSFARTA